MAGYSGTPLPKKLGIKPGDVGRIRGRAGRLRRALGPLPESVRDQERG